MANDQVDLRTVKALLKLLEEHKLDSLEVGNIKLVKSKHIVQEPIKAPKKAEKETPYSHPLYSSKEEQELFEWSSGN